MKLNHNDLKERSARMLSAYNNKNIDIDDLSTRQLKELLTTTQFLFDVCLNKLEERGEIIFLGDAPLIPYVSDTVVETILTR